MKFWWVNHNQTFRHEFQGHYIWSPKRMKNGNRNRFYDFLKQVVPGDLVLSYSDTRIQGAGYAVSYCYTCPRPAEFGHIGELWDIVGWRVDVNFQPLPEKVRPKDHLTVLKPIIKNEQYSPIRDTGDGLQHIYLTSISKPFAEVILGLAGADVQAFTRPAVDQAAMPLVEPELVGQQEWEDIEQRQIVESHIPETTRHALIKARIGQGLFKQRVAQIEHACRITLVDNPTHLIGSHIKPWRECDNEERLAGGNGLLLTPSADHLFDRGFITFEDSGEISVSPVADLDSLKRMGVEPGLPPDPLPFTTDQRHFLKHHRKEIFLSGVK